MFVVVHYLSYRWCEIRPLCVICLFQSSETNTNDEENLTRKLLLRCYNFSIVFIVICVYFEVRSLRLPTSTHIHIYTYKYTHVHAGIHTYTQLYVQVYKYIDLSGNHLIHNYSFIFTFSSCVLVKSRSFLQK